MKSIGLSLLILATLTLGCAHYNHPERDRALRRCQALIEVLDTIPPDNKTAKIFQRCDYLIAHEGCRAAYVQSSPCTDGTNNALVSTCAPAYCSQFTGERPGVCADGNDSKSADDHAADWSQLLLRILAYDIGEDDAGLLHSVITRHTLCKAATAVSTPTATDEEPTEPSGTPEHTSCSE